MFKNVVYLDLLWVMTLGSDIQNLLHKMWISYTGRDDLLFSGLEKIKHLFLRIGSPGKTQVKQGP